MKDELMLPSTRVLVQALSPFHIGTGTRLRNLDFSLSGSEITVIDEAKLLKWIENDSSGRLASDFTAHAEKGKPIREFLERHNQPSINLEAYKIQANVE